MKKSLIALTLSSLFCANLAFADNELPITSPELELIGDMVIVDETAGTIGRDSNDDSVRGYFDNNGDERSQQDAAVEYAAKVIENGGKAVGGAEKFAARQDFNGKAISAHDEMMTVATQAILDNPLLKEASPAEFKEAVGFSRAEVIEANSHYYNNRVPLDDALNANREQFKDIVEAGEERNRQIDENSRTIESEKDRNNQQDKQIGKIEDKQKSIGENVDKNAKNISDNKKLGENNKSRLDEITKGAGDEIDANRNTIHGEVDKQRKWNAEAEREQSSWNRSAEDAAGKMTTDISKNSSSINANRNSIEDNRLSIENLQAKTQQEINRLDNKIDVMEGRLSNGVAMSSAMSQMQFNGGAGVGVGVATFNGSNAIALGAGYSFGDEQQWMLRGSISHSQTSKGGNQSDTMAGAGITYSFN
ncbi:YadA-like family protein [Agarivorans aestuarii]|uniref:YadA-like family protein n=1 Tax=Agarivorans aestuarii TaxID=1563703 RepID=A0ABU7G8G8_9ALTE|nr:YadA-like family protein [Agarivorans aestuarii]MEE1675555.1 YadA-like family protein [Agarivorans aestuarii]